MPLPALVIFPVVSIVASVGLSVGLAVSAKKSRKAAKRELTGGQQRPSATASQSKPKAVPPRRTAKALVPLRRTLARNHHSRAAASGQPPLEPAETWRTEVAEIVDSPLGMPLILSSGGLVLATAAYLFPPLRLPALALSLVGSGPIFAEGFTALKQKKLNISVMNLSFVTAAATIAQPFMVSFLASVKYSGDLLSAEAEDRTRHELSNIFGGQVTTAWIRSGDDGLEIEVPVEKLSAGDLVVCRAGETLPVDGVIRTGTAMIDQHTLFGEQYPVAKSVGDQVFAGTTLVSGEIDVELRQTGSETVAGKVTQLLARTADYRSRIERRADRELGYSVPAILALSALAAPFVGTYAALGIMMSCPGLIFVFTAPFTTISALQTAGHRGILIKDGRAFEVLPEIDLVMFDKTGTLTLDTPEVGEIATDGGFDADDLVQLAALAEGRHTHPIARALRDHAGNPEASTPVAETEVLLGRGIAALVGNRRVAVGSARLLSQLNLTIPPSLFETAADWSERGSTTVFVAVDGTIAGAIELRHRLRPGVQACVEAFKNRGVACEIVSGDTEATTRNIASRLGIETFHAHCLPDQKRALVLERQKAGRRVCFVGDGINDAVALKAADISISMSGASHAAVDTAAVVLLTPQLDNVTTIFDLSRRFRQANTISRGLSYALPGAVLVSSAVTGISPLVAVMVQEVAYWGGMAASIFVPRQIDKPGHDAAEQPLAAANDSLLGNNGASPG